jgi:GNAT superfamily N-acetyltransferase
MLETKTFQIIQDNRRAAAELSQTYTNQYYFNRLIVDRKLRGRGLSIKLMNQVVEWADKNNIEIILQINPYGELDYLQLSQFYERFGFVWSDNEQEMIRRTNVELSKN